MININAGDFRHKIIVCLPMQAEDSEGFRSEALEPVCEAWAKVNTLSGYTLIKNNADFESATTNFTIRFPKQLITREMLVLFRGKTYDIQYLNNVDEANVLLEMQCKEVMP